MAQTPLVTVSGQVTGPQQEVVPFAQVVLKALKDSAFAAGTITNEEGRFSISGIKPGQYQLLVSQLGFARYSENLFVGSLSEFLEVPPILLKENLTTLGEVEVVGKQYDVGAKMDRKTFSVADNLTQNGSSVLQAMQNLPGVAVQDGKVQLRGSDKVMVLIDGKQTALTGFGGQSGLDNLPASAIEKIEVINNPSARYDANGNAGIINLIFKKEKQEGFTGKAGLTTGLGALWVRKENLPTIRPQYQATPKINPTLSLNYRKNKINAFFQGDYLYTQTLNKNEFVTRTYNDGTIIEQQTKRNRNTHFITTKLGLDWNLDNRNTITVSGMFGSEKIIDRGDEPFFNAGLTQRNRLWQFLEDELKTTVVASAVLHHTFKQPGRQFNTNLNYTFHREDEKYFFTNILPTSSGKDAFKLLSNENVVDAGLDYIQPLKYGRLEGGIKFRRRWIPTNMQFLPGVNSPLDTNAGGKATYNETIPALYGTYVLENQRWEAEAGLRVEYVKLRYDVNPNHNTYKSDGYDYIQPFPNVRLAWKINEANKISLFFNRRIDRPNEVDIRIFPKYDDAEIIKVGNPGLKPQFTSSVELGYKTSLKKGYLYSALYHRFANGTITRIAATVPGSALIYNVFQNVNRSYNTGVEAVLTQVMSKFYSFNLNLLAYHNRINAFAVQLRYPQPQTVMARQLEIWSGQFKMNHFLKLPRNIEVQFTAIYLSPDLVPQGKTNARFTLDAGVKKKVGRSEFFFNATDLLNTLVIRREIKGNGFRYISTDYYETQVIRLGCLVKY